MKLTEEQAIQYWMDKAQGHLSEDQEQQLMEYLAGNPELKAELEQNQALWSQLEKLERPAPSEAMDARFDGWLHGYAAAAAGQERGWQERLTVWWRLHWQPSLAFLAVGLLVGALVLPGSQEPEQLAQEVKDMKKMLMLTLIEQPQAQERIKAVSLASELPTKNPDQVVVQALVTTLNQDPSINVRLSALEALMAYGENDKVRRALIQSIARQSSPLMQVALADAMVLLQEKAAVDSFNQLLDSAQVNESVESKIKSTIETLKAI
ncbi:HEAT repeat domain-containing protein [Marinoscillum furvescens]|uniref:HEAT repeat protein n=1 Tax=Marinoscillum furvescens DSM 4134 TaxID=1122208 RepID=A0A3D9L4M3_MARFU|nr:HEAT repeat domain-containing protein [Marinoscillum furvescens]REE00563.1 HEAT repeat protein [Marinoscillum furvescens DSM 4134]